MSCPFCDPLGRGTTSCGFCKTDRSDANGEKNTESTGSSRTNTDAVEGAVSVATLLPRTGIPPNEYLDILADLGLMLAGREGEVDVTPLLQMAQMAVELELAERMIDALGNSAGLPN